MNSESTTSFLDQSPSASLLIRENEQLRRENQRLAALVQQQQLDIAHQEQRWKFALDGLGDAIWEINLQTGDVVHSPRYRDMLGYSPDELPNTMQAWKNLLHPDDQNILIDLDQCQTGSLESYVASYRLRCKDGSYKYFLDRGRLFSYDGDGKPLLMIGSSTDITPQVNMENALRTNSNQLSNLITNLQEGILLEDAQRKIVLVNQYFCDMFSMPVTPEQLKGVDCSGMAEQSKGFFKYPDQFVARVNQLLAEQKVSIGDELELADGRIFERDYVPVFTDDVYAGHLWKYTDITRRKLDENAAVRQKEKYQRIIENMNLGLIEVDLDERIVYTNQSFCMMSGYEPDELIGRVATDILLKGQNVQVMEEKNRSRLTGKSDAYEVAIKNKRGEAMWWLISGAPLYSETGEIIGSTGIHLDITKQKQLESELRVAKQEAENSSKAKELFLANMSHEIRTPMNAILNLGQQLAKTSLTDQQGFFLSMINTAASNLLVIINDVLDFSKIEAGQLSLEQIGFNMAELVQRAVHVMAQNAKEKGLHLSATVDSTLAPVLIGDPYRLNQILLNLISNAIKFTNAGSVLVHCTCRNFGRTQSVHITVTDTGIGIDPDFQRNLFTKFTQEDDSIGRRYGGTGLGMSITKQLVDMMGGSIRVSSAKNKGTTVYVQVTLPVGTAENLVARKQTPQKDALLADKRILLVEDNDMNRLVVRTVLKPYGVDITEATNGQYALEALRSQAFDLVLMDVQMPVMDGLLACQIIRRDINPSIPIIALTASAIRSEKEACYQAGMNDFLAKPFDEKDLIEKLAKWLNATDIPIPVQPSVSSMRPLYDLSKLEDISRGNQEFVLEMISLFCRETPLAVDQIRAAYAVGDYAKIKYLAHRIKPSVDNLGIYSQKEAIRDIEHLASIGGDADELKELINEFTRVITEVMAHMRANYTLVL